MKKILLLVALMINLSAETTTGIKKFETDCLNKNANSCYQAGMYYLLDEEGKDLTKGVSYLAASCKYGRGRSCILVGKMFLDKKMYDESLNYFKLGCDYGEDNSCQVYKDIYTSLKG